MKSKKDNDKHVYCTDCKNVQWILNCIEKHKNINTPLNCNGCVCDNCDCWNFEDSRPFKERPFYRVELGLTSEKKAGLKQIMGKYSGKASLSTIEFKTKE